MTFVQFWWGALALNGAWLVLLPSRAGKATALAGIVIAAFALVRARSSRTGSRDAALPIERGVPGLLLFLLPAITWWRTVHVVFLTIDGRLILVAAWLLGSLLVDPAVGRGRRNASEPPGPSSVGLFLFWACAFWLICVWDVGLGTLIAGCDRVGTPMHCQSDPIAAMVSVWETSPVREHLFLPWRSVEAFQTRMAYASHSYAYTLGMYGWIAAARWVARVPLFAASNSTVLLAAILVLWSAVTLLIRTGLAARCRNAAGLLSLFLAIGLVATGWRFWIDMLRYNTDNVFPLLAALTVFVYALLLPPARPRLAVLAAVAFCAISPLSAPMLLLPVACVFWRGGVGLREIADRNRAILQIGLWSTVIAAAAIGVVRLVIAWKGYTPLASTLVSRTGLDGDSTYFTNMFQALWSSCPGNCCYVRPPADLLVPAAVPLLILPFSLRVPLDDRLRPASMLLFLCTPYLVSLILFPQSVSIHPYLYDHQLLIPIVITGAVGVVATAAADRWRGTFLLGMLLFTGGVIMWNLIAIAQGVARIPHG